MNYPAAELRGICENKQPQIAQIYADVSVIIREICGKETNSEATHKTPDTKMNTMFYNTLIFLQKLGNSSPQQSCEEFFPKYNKSLGLI